MHEFDIELTAVPEALRNEALNKFYTIRPFLEKEISLPKLSLQTNVPLRTLRRRVKQYREHGLTGLIRKHRDRPESARVLEKLVEGLVLESPKSIASIKRLIDSISKENCLTNTSYSTVYRIARRMDKRLVVLAHAGSKEYCDKFDIVFRRECSRPNEIWQADHSLLDCWVLDAKNKLVRPWLTVILDDYSRAVCGYLISSDAPCSLNTALALHQAIWRKADARWHVLGIPERFYTDNGSDFTSKHMEQVAADLKC